VYRHVEVHWHVSGCSWISIGADTSPQFVTEAVKKLLKKDCKETCTKRKKTQGKRNKKARRKRNARM
jgi:hypothetical protein